jgi:hypothetical protein
VHHQIAWAKLRALSGGQSWQAKSCGLSAGLR